MQIKHLVASLVTQVPILRQLTYTWHCHHCPAWENIYAEYVRQKEHFTPSVLSPKICYGVGGTLFLLRQRVKFHDIVVTPSSTCVDFISVGTFAGIES